MSGLSIFAVDYSARLHQTFGASAGISYFIRNDLGTYQGYPLEVGSEGYFLGPEIYAKAIWSGFSDLQVSLAGGAFFPSLGNAGKDEPIRWKVELTATMSF